MEAIKQVAATLYVAFGEAAGGDRALRVVNRVVRDAIADRAVDDPIAVEFLTALTGTHPHPAGFFIGKTPK